MQREIEAAGFPTITLTSIPAVTASVSVPRLAAIEYPLGRPFGEPHDREGQLAVLRATLNAFEAWEAPGGVVHLPYEWPESPREVRAEPKEPPPITKYLRRHPWLFPKLLAREVPD